MTEFLRPGRLLWAGGEGRRAPLVVYGLPFDATTSYRPGARFGPQAIRAASHSLEEYSPFFDRQVEAKGVSDLGDLSLPPDPEGMVEAVEAAVHTLKEKGRFPFGLGGEHLVTLGAVRALAKVHPDLRVLQLDAHADLRDAYEGATLSHATVMRRVRDLLGQGRLFQVGVRSGTREEFRGAEFLWRDLAGLKEAVQRMGRGPAYLSLDIDLLDPADAPGTGTPEPGGPSYRELQAQLGFLAGPRWVGADLVEVAPGLDPTGRTAVLAAKLLRELTIFFQKEGLFC